MKRTNLRVGRMAVVAEPLGLKIELVPLVDPPTLAAGARLRVRLLPSFSSNIWDRGSYAP